MTEITFFIFQTKTVGFPIVEDISKCPIDKVHNLVQIIIAMNY